MFKPRNPVLVILWSFGLFIVIQFWRYPAAWLAARAGETEYVPVLTGEYSNPTTVLVLGLAGVIIGIPLVFLVIRFLWRRDLGWMCFRPDHRRLLAGIVLGFLTPVVVLALLWLFGGLSLTEYPARFSSREIVSILVGHAGLTLFSGVAQEAVFRGMVVRELAARWGWALAVVVGGLYFGFVHLISGGVIGLAEVAWISAGSVSVSFLFVALLIRSRSLWLPIGFHTGWNFCLAAVTGAVMSGGESSTGLFKTELSGSTWLTGGEFGMETSVVSIVLYVLLGIAALRYRRPRDPGLLTARPESPAEGG